jgi:hypothetical protein
LGDIPIFGEDTKTDSMDGSSACCIPLNINESSDKDEAACCVSQMKLKM